MSVQINFVVDQGSKFTGIVCVTNEDGSPFDLTDYTPFSHMRKSYYTKTFYEISAEVFGEPTNGEIKLIINPSVSNSARPGRYVYDVEIHGLTDDDRQRVAEGLITLYPRVTQISNVN